MSVENTSKIKIPIPTHIFYIRWLAIRTRIKFTFVLLLGPKGLRDESYVGLAINVAATLAKLAHGCIKFNIN